MNDNFDLMIAFGRGRGRGRGHGIVPAPFDHQLGSVPGLQPSPPEVEPVLAHAAPRGTLSLSPGPNPPNVLVNGTDNATDLEAVKADPVALTNGHVEELKPEVNPPSANASGVGLENDVAMDGVELAHNSMPRIRVVPYVKEADESDKYPGAIEVLADYANSFQGIDLKYSYEVIKPRIESATPTLYKASVTAACRSGSGIGATMAEAKSLAAEACLRDIYFASPSKAELELLLFKKTVTTDPAKDILFVLETICKDYGMKKPTFLSEPSGTEVCYKCIIGNYVAEGRAGKAAVAMRLAALDMYNLIREKYNSGTLAVTTYL